MKDLLDILKYTIPSLLVFATAYFLIRQFIRRDEQKQQQELILNNRKQITPMRLQAYERITLLLERISPDSLIIRLNESGKTNQWLQHTLLSTIRQEFEHNLTQQLYVSPKAWELTRNAKESIIQLINSAALHLDPNNSSLELCQMILKQYMESNTTSDRQALDYLKREIHTLF